MGNNKKQLTLGFILLALLVVGYYGLKVNQVSDNHTIDDNVNLIIEDDSLEIAFGYVEENISEISPVEAVLGGTWYVSRFWTIDDTGADTDGIERFYVEYEDGHIMSKILVDVIADEFSIAHEVKAVFEPGEAGWILVEGEDLEVNKEVYLYEKDPGSEQWVKK